MSLLLVFALVCLMSAGVAEAKGKKGKGKKKAPATVEDVFAHMNPNSEGLVNEAGLVAFKKWQSKSITEEKAAAWAKKAYPKILGYMKGDSSKGFNIEAYKAYKAAQDAKKAAAAAKKGANNGGKKGGKKAKMQAAEKPADAPATVTAPAQ